MGAVILAAAEHTEALQARLLLLPLLQLLLLLPLLLLVLLLPCPVGALFSVKLCAPPTHGLKHAYGHTPSYRHTSIHSNTRALTSAHTQVRLLQPIPLLLAPLQRRDIHGSPAQTTTHDHRQTTTRTSLRSCRPHCSGVTLMAVSTASKLSRAISRGRRRSKTA